MRWTNHFPSALPAVVAAIIPACGLIFLCICIAIGIGAMVVSGAPPGKHLSVYSVAANYSLPLVQREGRDYVGLLEVLEPLGKVSAKSDSRGWRLRYNNVEGDFQVGKTRARVQGRDDDLGGRFLVENNRGLVPVTSLPSLLPRFLGGPAAGRPNGLLGTIRANEADEEADQLAARILGDPRRPAEGLEPEPREERVDLPATPPIVDLADETRMVGLDRAAQDDAVGHRAASQLRSAAAPNSSGTSGP